MTARAVMTTGFREAQVTDERERAAELCEKLAAHYEEKNGARDCCGGALRVAASRIRIDDDLAKEVGQAARRIREQEGF